MKLRKTAPPELKKLNDNRIVRTIGLMREFYF